MLDLSMSGIVKNLSNPQNIYDGMILALNYMPTKPVAVATAAIVSGTAYYVIQPETLLTQISVITISSGLGWAATEGAHRIGSKLWKKRLAEIDAELKECEKTPKTIETKRNIDELCKKFVDDFFADPEFLKNLDLRNNQNPAITRAIKE